MKNKTNLTLKSFAALATAFTFGLGAPALHAEEKDHKHEGHDHAHDKAQAGPNGGKVLHEVEPHLEFFVTEDRKVQITALGEDGKAMPIGEQTVRVTGGSRSNPTRMTFEKEGDVLLSDVAFPEGNDFPVVVHSSVPEKGLLRVEILGGEAVESVSYSYSIGGVEDFVRRITVKEWFEPGKVVRHQKGTRGMDVYSTVIINFLDGRTEERKYYSGYRASPEVYWVGPGYEESDLPDLPRHAKGVEGRLHEDGSDVYPTSG